jgi:hypothetical protein
MKKSREIANNAPTKPETPVNLMIELIGANDLDLFSSAISYCKGLTKSELAGTHRHKGVIIKITTI